MIRPSLRPPRAALHALGLTLSFALLVAGPASAAPPASVTPLLDLDVTWDGVLTAGAPATFDVAVFAARDLGDRTPRAAELTVALAPPSADPANSDAPERVLWRATTLPDGRATPRFTVPADARGAHRLIVRAHAPATDDSPALAGDARRDVLVHDATALSLRFDRTLYQPGHTVRWRLAALGLVDAHPLARADVDVTIRDPRRTAVWRGTVTTDDRGLASGALPLADELITGDYTLEARADAARAEATFTVRPFTLPPFLVAVDLDHTALAGGARAAGTITARTAYGEPVRGDVTAELRFPSGARASLVRGQLADDGSAPFDAPLPEGASGPATVHVRVTDGAGRDVDRAEPTRVGAPHLDVALVPDAATLIAGRHHRFHVLTTDEAGEPVAARVTLTVALADGDGTRDAVREADSDGVAELVAPVPEARRVEHVVVTGVRTSWQLDAPRPLDDELTEALEASVDRHVDRVARCASEPLTVHLAVHDRRWVVHSVTTLPFPERPELPFDAPPEVSRCVGQQLRHALPEAPRALASATLRFTVRPVATPNTRVHAVRRVTVRATATTAEGRRATVVRTVDVRDADGEDQHAHVAPAVVAPGESITVRAAWPTDSDAPVVATLLRRGAPIATAACRREGDEVVAELAAPPGAFGLATVRLHQAAWTRANLATANRAAAATVFLRPPRLEVAVAAPTRALPGADAALDVTVYDPGGAPVSAVGLTAAIVDERILALSSPQLSLSDVLERDDLAAIGERARLFARLLADPDPSPLARAAMRALLAALPRSAAAPDVAQPARARLGAELIVARDARATAVPALAHRPGAVVSGEPGASALVVPLDDLLRAAGWDDARRADPWGRVRTWELLTRVEPTWDADTWATWVTHERLDLLVARLEPRAKAILARLGRSKTLDPARLVGVRHRHLATDAWGHAVVLEGGADIGRLRSPGPDGVLDTDDDVTSRGALYPPNRWSGIGYAGSGMGGGGGVSHRGQLRIGRASNVAEPQVAALRERFDETALWVVGETTDRDGRARFPFTLSDSVTGWDVRVEAIGAHGALGVGHARIETFLPVHVELQAPARLTVGDRHEVAAVVANHEARAASFDVALAASDGLALDGPERQTVVVPAGAVRAARFTVRAEAAGEGRLEASVSDSAGRARDALARSVRVAGPGLAEARVIPGRLRDGRGEVAATVPEDADPETIRGRLRVFRGAADLALDGLESMLREPTGCFEQTTSTSWPNLLVMRLLRDAPGRQAAVARAAELVGRGYQRLLRYEVPGGGFSYWGRAPASVPLTAMGLVQFHDMAAVHPVDPALLARTRAWLTSRQQPDGSWESAASRWSEAKPLQTTAWVTWALAQTGGRGGDRAVDRGLAHLRRARARAAKDPYALALWAAAEGAAGGRPELPLGLLDAHRRGDDARASYVADGTTLMYGSGRGGAVEVTALAAAARLGAGGVADAELAWLWEARSPRFGWGSTQATVHSLRAAAMADVEGPAGGEVTVRLDGEPLGTLDLGASDVPTLALPPGLAPGRHTLSFEGPPGHTLRADLRLSWRGREAPAPAVAGLGVHLVGPAEPVALGTMAAMEVAVVNRGDAAVAMPTVVIPVPPGFRPDHDSLAALVRDTPVARFDDLGDRVALYLEGLGAGEGLRLPYRLEAIAPCDVAQAPAEAFAYYDPDVRGHSGALRLSAVRP